MVMDIVVGPRRVSFYLYWVLGTQIARYIRVEEADKLVSALAEWACNLIINCILFGERVHQPGIILS